MKTAIITGVSGGMGYATALQLLREGYRVYGLDLKPPKPAYRLHFIRADLTDTASLEHALEIVSAATKSIDCIIHLAGIYLLDSLTEISEEEFIRIFQVNVFSIYRTNKTFLPLLKKRGRIVITSSELAPLDPLPFTGIYAITKTAVEKYAYSLRMELQLRGYEVIVIRPGAVDTGLLNDSTAALDRFCKNTKAYSCNAERFRRIVNSVETRNVPPKMIALIISKALRANHPKYVYNINRNPLLLLMNRVPDRLQNRIIKKIIK